MTTCNQLDVRVGAGKGEIVKAENASWFLDAIENAPERSSSGNLLAFGLLMGFLGMAVVAAVPISVAPIWGFVGNALTGLVLGGIRLARDADQKGP